MDKIVYLGIVIGLFVFVFSTESKHVIIFDRNTKKFGYFLFETAMLFLVIVIMCANNDWGDALAYENYFSYLAVYRKNPWDGSYEVFTQCVLLIMRLWEDISYGWIRALIFSVCWLIIIHTYNRYISNFNLVVFFYISTFMFAHDGAQIKNFVAVALLLLGCSFLIEKKRGYLIKYYVVMFMAVLMHFSCVVYFLLPLIHAKSFKKYNNWLPLVGGGLYLVMYVLGTKLLSDVLGMIASIFPLIDKVTKYLYLFSGKRSLVYVSIYYVIYMVMRFLVNLKYSFLNSNCQDYQYQKFGYMINNVWKLMGIFLPLLLYANTVFRLYRNLMILVFILMTNSIIKCKRLSKSRIKNSVCALTIVLALLFQPIVLGQAIDIFDPVFDGKLFWNY